MSVLSISHSGPLNPNPEKTYSPLGLPRSFQNKLTPYLDLGHIHGPFPALLCMTSAVHLWVQPLINEIQMKHLQPLLMAHSSSVNDEIPNSEGEIQYESFAYAVASLCKWQRSVARKLDIKDTFCHIPVRSTDWNLLGFSWCDKFYYPVVLMFVGNQPHTSSTFLLSPTLDHTAPHPGGLCHYLDHFLPISSH